MEKLVNTVKNLRKHPLIELLKHYNITYNESCQYQLDLKFIAFIFRLDWR